MVQSKNFSSMFTRGVGCSSCGRERGGGGVLRRRERVHLAWSLFHFTTRVHLPFSELQNPELSLSKPFASPHWWRSMAHTWHFYCCTYWNCYWWISCSKISRHQVQNKKTRLFLRIKKLQNNPHKNTILDHSKLIPTWEKPTRMPIQAMTSSAWPSMHKKPIQSQTVIKKTFKSLF